VSSYVVAGGSTSCMLLWSAVVEKRGASGATAGRGDKAVRARPLLQRDDRGDPGNSVEWACREQIAVEEFVVPASIARLCPKPDGFRRRTFWDRVQRFRGDDPPHAADTPDVT